MCGDYLDRPTLSVWLLLWRHTARIFASGYRSEMASKANFCDNRQLLARLEVVLIIPGKNSPRFRASGKLQCWHVCASVGASQTGMHTSEQDISRHVMWHNVPPPLPQLLAHMPQIPAPCLNRCSINNACLNATHLPSAQSGERRVDEGDATKWMSLLGRGTRGTRNGRGPRSLSDYWEMDWPHQKMLKDQWTWGWSVLVPSAPNSGNEKKSLRYLELRERSAGRRTKEDQVGQAERGGVAIYSTLVFQCGVLTLRAIM